MKKIVLFFLCLNIIGSCNHRSNDPYIHGALVNEQVADIESKSSANFASRNNQMAQDRDQKIIKNGMMGIEVNNIEAARIQIDTIVQDHGAYLSNESLSKSDYLVVFNLQIRIPSDGFDPFIHDVESIEGEIIYKNISTRDVTEEYIDLETRLDNKRKYMERYQQLVDKAVNVKEILEIQERIRLIEEEIESAEGRLRYLENQLSYSTLDLEIRKEIPWRYRPKDKPEFYERLKKSISKGWDAFVKFSLGVISLWPFWLLLAVLWMIWKKIRLRLKK